VVLGVVASEFRTLGLLVNGVCVVEASRPGVLDAPIKMELTALTGIASQPNHSTRSHASLTATCLAVETAIACRLENAIAIKVGCYQEARAVANVFGHVADKPV